MKRDLEQLIHDLIGIVFDLTRRPGAHSQLALDGFRRDAEELRDRLGELEPAQPQPREATRAERSDADLLEARVCEHAHEGNICPICQPAQPQPRGEGDDLAARLEEKSNVEEGLRPARPTNLPGPDLYHLGRAEAFAEAAQLARASTHPEQWGGSIRGCSPSSTRTPPTNAGRRGLAGSTDTNAPRGSCSNEPMPR